MTNDKPTLLVVDDKRNMLSLITKIMKDETVVRTARTGQMALDILRNEPVHIVLCDLRMPGIDGLEVLRACRQLQPQAVFVLMTAYASVDTAVEALKSGAYDYLTKPFSPDEAKALLLRALGGVMQRDSAREKPLLPGIIAASQPMHQVAELVRKIAPSEANALILGETGTGKELVARAVHSLSARAGRFVAVNCAAIPAELIESELFGHLKGAFTGAVRDSAGLFSQADGGTLFLDEIGELGLALQAKLTRVLDQQRIRPVGAQEEIEVDVRVVAATHRDLPAMVKAGTFREDLWYRLNVAPIVLPPLRARDGDAILLAHHFLRREHEKRPSKPALAIAPAAEEAIARYDWPGNVRQLRAAMERASLVADDVVALEHLPDEVVGQDPSEVLVGDWNETIERGRKRLGRQYLERLLRRYNGQVSEAAAHAGVERESFYRLLRRHDIDPKKHR